MKQMVILGGIFFLLIAGYVALKSFQKNDSFEAPEGLTFSAVRSDDVGEVRVSSSSGGQVVIARTGTDWLVNGHEADATKIEQVLLAFSALKAIARVSSNAENHSRFQVDADKGLAVSIDVPNGMSKSVVLGKSAGVEEVYMRLTEDDDVFTMKGLSRGAVSDDEDFWRERRLFTDSIDAVNELRFQQGRDSWLVRRPQGEEVDWLLSRATKSDVVDAGKVQAWLESLAKLQAVGFLTEEELSQPIENPVQTLTLSTSVTGKESVTFDVYPAESPSQIQVLRRDGKTAGVLVSKSSFETFFLNHEALLDRLRPYQEPAAG